jgi:hypothetical protein
MALSRPSATLPSQERDQANTVATRLPGRRLCPLALPPLPL